MKSNIAIYKTNDKKVELKLDIKKKTVWLNLNQIVELFERDKSVISRHINNIFNTKELQKDSTVAFFATVQKEGNRKITRDIEYYNLDVVISVGYRVNSKRGTEFRIWATNILRDYLVKGYVVNQKLLEADAQRYHQLQSQIKTLRKVVENEDFTLDQSKELIKIISDYTDGLELIDNVDNGDVKIPISLNKKVVKKLSYIQAKAEIDKLKISLNAHQLFGNEKDDHLESILQSVVQTFDKKDLYPSIEEKAANLLYLIIKDHPFTDGNKRIGSFMFVRFLDINNMLYKKDETKLVEENALVAMTLLVAQSDPNQKELMVKLIMNLITS